MQKQTYMLLLCILLAACGTQPAPAQPAHPTTAATSTPTSIPTARIRSTPVVPAEIIVPTFTPTPEPIPALPISTTVRVPAAPREGPGGLPYPLRLSQLDYGAVGHFYYTDRDTAYTMATEAGFAWIRQQVHWRDVEDRSGAFYWDELNHIVDEANQHGLKVMLSVVRSPAWYTADGSDGLPEDPATLARFLGELVRHFQGNVHAIQVWNEQNLAHENGGTVALADAGHYVELLAASYTAMKAVDPGIIVVAGGLAPTRTNIPTIAVPDIDYLEAMYAYNDGMIRDYFDVQGLHPFGFANPPETLWPDEPSATEGWNENETFYFRHIENARRVMLAAGLERHQVWITEFGWATANNTPGYEYGNLTSFEAQGDYIVRALEMVYNDYPWISNVFVWNLNFTVVQEEHGVDPLHEQGSFSIVHKDWTPRPAYTGIQAFIAERRQQEAQGIARVPLFVPADPTSDPTSAPTTLPVAVQPTSAPTTLPVAVQPTSAPTTPPVVPTATPTPTPTQGIAGGKNNDVTWGE